MHRRAVVLGAGLLWSTAPLAAQELSLFVGGAHARYADSLSGTAGVASARLRVGSGLRGLGVQAAWSQFATGEWAVQAGGQATAFFPLSRQIAAGVAGGGTVSNFQEGSPSWIGAAGPMLVLAAQRLLFTAGASAGAVRSVDQVTRTVGSGSLRARYTAAPELFLDLGAVGTTAEDDISYADLTGGVTWHRGNIVLAASAGARAGDLADDPWGQVRLEYAANAFTRLELSAGRYPRDLTGFTDGLFVQAGVRLTAGAPPPAARSVRSPSPVRVLRIDRSRVRVTFRYHDAVTQLALAGDFSEWEPVPLVEVGRGEWTAELSIEPGVHHYALIVDGVWTLPDGVAGIGDGFGGKVGVLVVGG
jgi:hypothetical protein